MAWTLRRLPLFGIPGDGKYRVQPVLVDDVADLCISLAARADDADVVAAGPETLEYNDLVNVVKKAVGSPARIVHLPTPLVLAAANMIGLVVRDKVLTRDELRELMESLLVSDAPATTPTKFTEWVAAHGPSIGRRYSSELNRNFRIKR
jgi:NADH dehydrogenase